MSWSLFSLLASVVTLGGVFAVVLGARLGGRLQPSRTKPLAAALLLSYALVLILRPSAWPLMNLGVLLGAIGGVLLLERGLGSVGAVAVFLAVAAVVDASDS